MTRGPSDPTKPSQDKACWLCDGLGGVAVYLSAKASNGRKLWVAHEPKSDSHPVPACPACTLDKTEADLRVLRAVRAATPEMVEQALTESGRKDIAEAESERNMLKEALRYQEALWLQIPGGIDDDADPKDECPQDAAAHLGGLAVRAIRKALKGAK